MGTYVLCDALGSDDFVLNFVVVLSLLSVDFWVVKNVSGRLLVGLRYWNETAPDGSSKWRFESRAESSGPPVTSHDSAAFWWPLYTTVPVWLALGVIAALKINLQYLIVVIVALVMNGSNAVGYIKCSKDQQEVMRSAARTTVAKGLGVPSNFL